CAGTVGEFIDVKPHPDILGTVAGDNTLLIVPSSVKKTLEVLRYLKHILIEGR
ncbi:MAG: Arginine repressor, C-terminal domain, partial [candidate division NC10 bacterium]|nr:Arginine repressor, C-terminal domain [candidate division NC10 bacterium]